MKISAPTAVHAPPPATAGAPVEPDVALSAVPDTPLLARLDAKPDLSTFETMPRGPERRQAVYDALVDTAQASQGDAIARLEQLQQDGVVASFEPMVLPNAIVVQPAAGKSDAVRDALAGVANLAQVTENERFSVEAGADGPSQAQRGVQELRRPGDEDGPTWGVRQIGAPELWAKGIDGTGVTVGVVDSGLDATHPAIAPHYRGTQADGTQVHDYNWYDPFDESPTPKDVHYHGTHVAGTIAGGAPGGPQIGVAPGAKLIAARANEADGYNVSIETLKALQFMLAPTKTDGTEPDPRKGADVINNSWGTSTRQYDPSFRDSFDALRAAGTIIVTAAGNEGRDGNDTVHSPGNYPGFTSVAATDARDAVTSFSSRGKPGSELDPATMTPNIAAPGSNILSSVTGGGYEPSQGTSMASPHVAGAVALALSAKPDATEQEIRQAIFDTAVDVEEPGPDIKTGYGRIDIAAAVDKLTAGSSASTTDAPTS